MMSQVASNDPYLVHRHNLPFYRIRTFDAYPDLVHAIFTRQGGFSATPFHSLNLGSAVGDDFQTVRKNFKQACQAVEVLLDQTVSCHLVHGVEVLTINKQNRQQVMGKADGLITNTPNIYLAMRFADCTPLIFFDPIQQAIGLTHAGWRGTMQNAAGCTVKKMVEAFGCQPKNIITVIGPAIGPCCYEVGTEVITAAAKAFTSPDLFFTRRNGNPKHAYFDMWEANRQQLVASGVDQIIKTRLCTACHTDKFFSHRAEGGRTGRFGVIIGIRNNHSE